MRRVRLFHRNDPAGRPKRQSWRSSDTGRRLDPTREKSGPPKERLLYPEAPTLPSLFYPLAQNPGDLDDVAPRPCQRFQREQRDLGLRDRSPLPLSPKNGFSQGKGGTRFPIAGTRTR